MTPEFDNTAQLNIAFAAGRARKLEQPEHGGRHPGSGCSRAGRDGRAWGRTLLVSAFMTGMRLERTLQP
jgi:hypothetical protein